VDLRVLGPQEALRSGGAIGDPPAQAIRAHWPDDVRRRFYLTYLAERDAQGRIRGAKALASI